jgi:DNA-binding transcriptional MocR family regulator
MSDAVMKYFPDGTRVSRPQGGFVLWVELPDGTDSFELAQRALKQGVSIALGPLFSASGKFGNFLRLSCAWVWDDRLERALVTLTGLIKRRESRPQKNARHSANRA